MENSRRLYAIVEEVYDKKTNFCDFSQCVGVRENYESAIGLAYITLDERREENKKDFIITTLEEMNSDTGLYIKGMYEKDSFYTIIRIYFVDN